MTRRLMVDIETMSTHNSNALILSVGACSFTSGPSEFPIISEQRLWVLDIAQQLLACRIVDMRTQKFWQDQKPDARVHWTKGDTCTTFKFEQEFENYLEAGCDELWANGIVFDIGNLASLWPIGAPWKYNSVRDARTVYCHWQVLLDREAKLAEVKAARDAAGLSHDPISDCEWQVWQLWARGL